MGFDLFVQTFRDGEPADVPTRRLREPFERFVVREEPRCLVLAFADGQQSDLYLDTTAPTGGGLMLSRPVRDPPLFDALFDLLRDEGTVLMIPGEVPPLTGTPATAPHLPADLVEALGTPQVLASGADIVGWIERA